MKIYTDEELQVAIDVAFSAKTGEAYLARRPDVATKSWPQESLLRLAIAKAFLEKLESDPYAALKKAHAEGKVIQHRFSGHLPWNDTDKPEFLSSREYRIKPDEPETFEAHGKTWAKHKAGDPMPCPNVRVDYLMRGRGGVTIPSSKPELVIDIDWTADKDFESSEIIGWRYADELMLTKPISSTSWTPAVGDIVQLKSGGPKMTVALLKETLCKCQWFRGDEADLETFEIATLQPVTE